MIITFFPGQAVHRAHSSSLQTTFFQKLVTYFVCVKSLKMRDFGNSLRFVKQDKECITTAVDDISLKKSVSFQKTGINLSVFFRTSC